MRKLLFPFLCMLATTSSSSEVTAIYGGVAVARDDPLSRQIVLIEAKKRDRHFYFCAGFLYSKNMIVTAAHCLLIVPENSSAKWWEKDRDAPQVRVADVKVFYRYAREWLQPKDFRVDRDSDVAVIVMRLPHPAGYQVGVFDERSSSKILQEPWNATFVFLGHEKLGPGSTGEVRRLNIKLPWLFDGSAGRVLIQSENNAGICHGDSGSPVYIQEGNGSMKVIGMHQATGTLNAKLVIPGTDGKCSRASIFMPMARVKEIVEKLTAE